MANHLTIQEEQIYRLMATLPINLTRFQAKSFSRAKLTLQLLSSLCNIAVALTWTPIFQTIALSNNRIRLSDLIIYLMLTLKLVLWPLQKLILSRQSSTQRQETMSKQWKVTQTYHLSKRKTLLNMVWAT